MNDNNSINKKRQTLKVLSGLGLLGMSSSILLACAREPNSFSVLDDGTVILEINDGLNCFAGNCIRINIRDRLISSAGREAVEIPHGILLEIGSITLNDFEELVSLARRAPRKQSDNDSSNGGGGSGGGSGGGGGGSGGHS